MRRKIILFAIITFFASPSAWAQLRYFIKYSDMPATTQVTSPNLAGTGFMEINSVAFATNKSCNINANLICSLPTMKPIVITKLPDVSDAKFLDKSVPGNKVVEGIICAYYDGVPLRPAYGIYLNGAELSSMTASTANDGSTVISLSIVYERYAYTSYSIDPITGKVTPSVPVGWSFTSNASYSSADLKCPA